MIAQTRRLRRRFRYWRTRRAARICVRSGLTVMLTSQDEQWLREVAAGQHRLREEKKP